MATTHVTGMGGLFFRSKDPAAVAAWYTKHFGIPYGATDGPWMPGAGPVVVSPFESETDYFGGAQEFMMNFRISDLDAFLADLAADGVTEVKAQETMEGIGRFAWVADPEGRRIELWEPAAGLTPPDAP